MRIRFVHLFVTSLFVATVVFAQGDAGQAIRDVGNRWSELFNQGDFEGVVDIYTEDALLATAFGAFEGHDAIRAYFGRPGTIEEPTIRIDTDEVEIFGDAAYSMGTYVVSAPDGSTVMEGSWMARSKLVDGVWKMHRHVVNMLMPETEAAAP